MPIYVYRCKRCDHEVEIIHGINAAGPTTCAECGGDMRKALTTPAIHFKGSGWAKKDARAASQAKASGGSAEGKPSTAADAKSSSGDAAGSTESSSDKGSDAATGSGDAKSTTKSDTPAKSTTSKTTD